MSLINSTKQKTTSNIKKNKCIFGRIRFQQINITKFQKIKIQNKQYYHIKFQVKQKTHQIIKHHKTTIYFEGKKKNKTTIYFLKSNPTESTFVFLILQSNMVF